jgi:hypothetical protein
MNVQETHGIVDGNAYTAWRYNVGWAFAHLAVEENKDDQRKENIV